MADLKQALQLEKSFQISEQWSGCGMVLTSCAQPAAPLTACRLNGFPAALYCSKYETLILYISG
jgi:hypothetical protein